MVGGLGASTYDIAAAGDHDRNFYLWGAMGGAVMIGLGLALAQPEAAGRGHHRRRRDADGDGKPRDRRPAEAGQSHHRGARQRGLWRDRRAGEPHRRQCRPRRRRQEPAASRTPARSRPWPRSRLLRQRCRTPPAGPRFASIKIDSANLERVLSSRDGQFTVTRIRGRARVSADLARFGLVAGAAQQIFDIC